MNVFPLRPQAVPRAFIVSSLFDRNRCLPSVYPHGWLSCREQVESVSRASPAYAGLSGFMVFLCAAFAAAWVGMVAVSMFRACRRRATEDVACVAEASGAPPSQVPQSRSNRIGQILTPALHKSGAGSHGEGLHAATGAREEEPHMGGGGGEQGSTSLHAARPVGLSAFARPAQVPVTVNPLFVRMHRQPTVPRDGFAERPGPDKQAADVALPSSLEVVSD